jgi:hypothetical protein
MFGVGVRNEALGCRSAEHQIIPGLLLLLPSQSFLLFFTLFSRPFHFLLQTPVSFFLSPNTEIGLCGYSSASWVKCVEWTKEGISQLDSGVVRDCQDKTQVVTGDYFRKEVISFARLLLFNWNCRSE